LPAFAGIYWDDAYAFGKRLKTLKGLTPYEFIAKTWTKEPKRFTLYPIRQMPSKKIGALPHPLPFGGGFMTPFLSI